MLGDESVRPDGSDPSRDEASQSDAAISLLAFVENRGEIDHLWPQQQDWQPLPILHRAGSIAALADIVPVEDYCGPAADRQLKTLEWLAPRLARHAAILHWAMQWSPVFPVAFGTLYRTFEGLTSFMHAHESAIEDFFQTVAGKEEWTLKATTSFDRADKLEELARRLWPDWHALSPGTRYMRLCRERPALAALGRKEARDRLADMVEDLRPAVSAVKACDASLPHNDTKAETLGSYAVLVDIGATAQFQEQMQDFNARAALHDIAISLSGPWPPFGFRPHLG